MFVLIYLIAIVLANFSAFHFGPAITPLNAFIFIGLDLALRNYLSLKFNAIQMAAIIIGGGIASYLINPVTGIIAIASCVSFIISNLVDWGIYKTTKGDWIKKCLFGVTVGALIDSILFPTIAFGALMPAIVFLQFFAKVIGGAFWAYLLKRFV